MQLIYTTFPSLEEARRITKILLENRLIACANLIPGLEVHYVWKDALCQAQEIGAFLKTTKEQIPLLQETFLKEHPYDVPCFIVIDPIETTELFENWVKTQCQP